MLPPEHKLDSRIKIHQARLLRQGEPKKEEEKKERKGPTFVQQARAW